ncbi:hypothetical protein JCM14036_10540 [Desulfotomaculum defluvii]
MDTREVTNQYRLNKWIDIVRECRSSGQTVSAWCANNGISPASYYYWLKRIRTAACESLPSICSQNNSIVPLNISGPTTDTDPTDQKSSSDIIMRFGAVTLEISNNASAILIENTLRALQNVR